MSKIRIIGTENIVGAAVFHGRRAEYMQWPVNDVFLALAVVIAAARTSEVVR